MKNIKKFTAILLTLTTLIFSFSVSGFAADEEVYDEVFDDEIFGEEKELCFGEVKIFDGKLTIGYMDGYPDWNLTYEIEAVESGEQILYVTEIYTYPEGDNYYITDDRVVIYIDNGLFDENTEYRLTVTDEDEIVTEYTFNSTVAFAEIPEFDEEYYSFEEYSETDMSDKILVPVGYEKDLFIGGSNIQNVNNECAVEIDGMTITAKETGRGYLRLYDSENNLIDEAWTQVCESQPSSFVDTLTWSFRKFFEGAGESALNLLLMGRWTVEGVFVTIGLPVIILEKLIEYPFRMLFGEI